jgi:hypothetical protein
MSDNINRWENEEEWIKKAQAIKPREYYIDCDDAADHFCDSMNCHACAGFDYYGEPNGDGCEEEENFLDRIDDINFENHPEYAIEIIKKRDSEAASLRQRIAELEAEKEAMKCCGNCKNQGLGLDGMPRCDISTEIGEFPCTDDLEYWQPKERIP